jgi:hypothetical protein
MLPVLPLLLPFLVVIPEGDLLLPSSFPQQAHLSS